MTPRSDQYKAELTNEFVKKVMPYFENNSIKPIIDTTFSFGDVTSAHLYMEENKNTGKIILSIQE